MITSVHHFCITTMSVSCIYSPNPLILFCASWPKAPGKISFPDYTCRHFVIERWQNFSHTWPSICVPSHCPYGLLLRVSGFSAIEYTTTDLLRLYGLEFDSYRMSSHNVTCWAKCVWDGAGSDRWSSNLKSDKGFKAMLTTTQTCKIELA